LGLAVDNDLLSIMAQEYSDESDMQTGGSVTARGAEDGLVMGAYLSVLVLASMLTAQMPWLAFVAIALMLGVPFVTYRMICRGMDRGFRTTQHFAASWMHGITIFIFGSLIMGVVMYVYLRFINPDYIASNWRLTIAVLNADTSGQSAETARALARMYDEKMLPSAIQMSFAMMWLVAFTGSILSLLLTALARRMRGESGKSRV